MGQLQFSLCLTRFRPYSIVARNGTGDTADLREEAGR